MLLSGGCGSGSVWRAGEGQVKLMVVVVCFSLAGALFKGLIKSSPGLKSFLGEAVYLPDYLTYKWTLVIMVLVFAAYFLAATWNEETDKFTVDM